MSIVGCMEKQTIIHTYNGIYLNSKEKGHPVTYYIMDEP
jgi:hypothetical protein